MFAVIIYAVADDINRAPYLWLHASPAIPILFAYIFLICFSSFLHASLTNPGVSLCLDVIHSATLIVPLDITQESKHIPTFSTERRSIGPRTGTHGMDHGGLRIICQCGYGSSNQILQDLQRLAATTNASLPRLRQLCRDTGSSLRMAEQLRRTSQLPPILRFRCLGLHTVALPVRCESGAHPAISRR